MMARQLAKVLAVLAILAPLTLMLGPFGAVEAGAGVSDKIGHFVAFAVIMTALRILAPRRPLWILAALSLAIGVAVELIQGQIGRDADIMDVAADGVGIAAAWACLAFASVRRAWLATRP